MTALHVEDGQDVGRKCVQVFVALSDDTIRTADFKFK
jgi:hypothetical protein